MLRREPVVAMFLGIALIWGFGTAFLADAAGLNPLVAPASAAVVAAAFGWMRRGRDVTEVVGPAFAVAYLTYAGLALARIPQSDAVVVHWAITPLRGQWPAALIGGIPFALIFAIFVAVPVSWIPRRRRAGAVVEDRLGTFIKEYDPSRSRPRDEAAPRASPP
jgi:hypothetical protein